VMFRSLVGKRIVQSGVDCLFQNDHEGELLSLASH